MDSQKYIQKVESYLHLLPNNSTFRVSEICTEKNIELFKEIVKQYILKDVNYPHWQVSEDGNLVRKIIWDAFPNPYSEQA
jgi:argonaute-like protein implicated in RNA metabolism and viral defense